MGVFRPKRWPVSGRAWRNFWVAASVSVALGTVAGMLMRLFPDAVGSPASANPKPLLWACYLGGLSVSVGCGLIVFAVFRARGSIAGASAHRLSPATYLVAGAISVVVAIMVASRGGRQLIGRDFLPGRRERDRARSTPLSRMKSRADHALRDRSLAVAALVGALLAVPGPPRGRRRALGAACRQRGGRRPPPGAQEVTLGVEAGRPGRAARLQRTVRSSAGGRGRALRSLTDRRLPGRAPTVG
jgi:hypothetical protein